MVYTDWELIFGYFASMARISRGLKWELTNIMSILCFSLLETPNLTSFLCGISIRILMDGRWLINLSTLWCAVSGMLNNFRDAQWFYFHTTLSHWGSSACGGNIMFPIEWIFEWAIVHWPELSGGFRSCFCHVRYVSICMHERLHAPYSHGLYSRSLLPPVHEHLVSSTFSNQSECWLRYIECWSQGASVFSRFQTECFIRKRLEHGEMHRTMHTCSWWSRISTAYLWVAMLVNMLKYLFI